MTSEAEARKRLLAHYENKLTMLKELVVTLSGELALAAELKAKRAIQLRIAARENEIAALGWNIARVRETIGKP